MACLAALGMAIAAMQARSAEDSAETRKPHAIRVIQDPHTGMRWLLERSPENPGGPGRMVLLSADSKSPNNGIDPILVAAPIAPPVIRAGDRLTVEEHSAMADAQLEAVALGPAAEGAPLNLRLSIGGKVVRAIALGPGHAMFAASEGFR